MNTTLLLALVLVCAAAPSRCWWPFGEDEEEGDSQASAPSSDPPEGHLSRLVRAELRTAEDKFLAEAQHYLDLIPLEQCQYQVISELKQTCGEINEEELAKLSVELLNCQSETEGRQTFPCTQSMTLAQCTGPMNSDMWNAYHIISNRARSVCYAVRQQQFRRQTEMAVNRLSDSTMEQLVAVQELASNHREIREMAAESLGAMHSHQEALLEQQQQVVDGHQELKDSISSNLNELASEKSLIKLGQQQLSELTESIKKQLEEASQMLEVQEQKRKQSHSEILSDIASVKGNVKDVWERIENSTGELLAVLQNLAVQYRATTHNLHLINTTIGDLLHTMDSTYAIVLSQLKLLKVEFGGTQIGLRALLSIATHACFLLFATLCVLFVNGPAFSRIALLLMVAANVFADVRYQCSLSLYMLAAMEVALLTCNWAFVFVKQRQKKPSLTSAPAGAPWHGPLPPLPPLPPSTTKSFNGQESDSEFSGDESPLSTLWKRPHAHCGNNDQLLNTSFAETVAASQPSTPKPSRQYVHEPSGARQYVHEPSGARQPLDQPSTPRPGQPAVAHLSSSLLQSTPRSSIARRCSALTRTGMHCRLAAAPGTCYCHRHMGQ